MWGNQTRVLMSVLLRRSTSQLRGRSDVPDLSILVPVCSEVRSFCTRGDQSRASSLLVSRKMSDDSSERLIKYTRSCTDTRSMIIAFRSLEQRQRNRMMLASLLIDQLRGITARDTTAFQLPAK